MNSHKGNTAHTWRSRLSVAFAAAAAGGLGVIVLTGPTTPEAPAAPDPCAAGEVAKTIGSVATNSGVYLDAHPETNQALTAISQQQAGPQSVVALKAYFDANPEAAADMQRLQQPLASLSGRCKLPATIPQLLGLMQAVQQQAPGQSAQPGRLPSTQAVGVDTAPTTVQRSQGAGPLPGPAATPSR